MRIAMLCPASGRKPPGQFLLRERMAWLLAEGLRAKGVDVTLFSPADCRPSQKRHPGVPRLDGPDEELDQEVWDSLLISEVFERADDFDLIHNHGGSLPLTYSGLVKRPVVTTIYGMPSDNTLPVFKRFGGSTYYVSSSNASRSAELDYSATIYPGTDFQRFPFNEASGEYLLWLGEIGLGKGIREAVDIARLAGMDLVVAGDVRDQHYFETEIKQHLDGKSVRFVDSLDVERRADLLGKARAILHPVDSDEPFAQSIVEANACGTPALAFPGGCIGEIISGGINGFVVSDMQEAVEAVMSIDTISRADCRRHSQQKFSLDRMLEEYFALYSLILEQTKTEDRRPWGYFEVLSDKPDHKVKRLVVWPGKRLSLQRHRHRSERWTIVEGTPMVTIDTEEISLSPGEAAHIPVGKKHRLFSPGTSDVVLIEVQTGDYFGEDDIERFEDDFGRITP